jgi:hypothetical protein
MSKRNGLVLILLIASLSGIRCTTQPPPPPPEPSATATPTPTPTPEPSPLDTTDYLKPAPIDSEAPANTPRYSLTDAQSRGLIRYEMAGVDNSLSLMLKVERITDTDIDVYIVPGTVFDPGGGDVQRMAAWNVVGIVNPNDDQEAMRPVTSIYLPTTAPRFYLVDAYCLDFELANPSSQNTFVALAQPHVRAAQIISVGNSQHLSSQSIQSAIWIDENHVTRQQIQSHYTASDKEVDDAFDLLKDLPYPARKN